MADNRIGVYRRSRCQRYYCKVEIEPGVWKEFSTGTSKLRDALKKKAEIQRQIEQGCLPNDRSKWTLKDAVDEWLRDRKSRVMSGTYASDVTNCGHLKSVLGESTRLTTIANCNTTTRYQTKRIEDGVSPKTVNNEVLALRGILQTANLWQRVNAQYRPLKVPRTDVGVALSREQELKVLQVAQLSPFDAVAPYVAVLALRTGMRMKEIKQLRRDAIHLIAANPYVIIRRETTKTNAGARHVALDSVACWALRKLIARGCSLGATESNHYLLPTLLDMHVRKNDPLRGGHGWDPTHPMTSWDSEWEQLRTDAGLGSVRFHDLRHTYITRAAEANIPLSVCQAQVGHVSVTMTRHYVHISEGAIHAAAKQIEANSPELVQALAKFESQETRTGGYVQRNSRVHVITSYERADITHVRGSNIASTTEREYLQEKSHDA